MIDIHNQFFTPSNLTTTRGHAKKLFKYQVNCVAVTPFCACRVGSDGKQLNSISIYSLWLCKSVIIE